MIDKQLLKQRTDTRYISTRIFQCKGISVQSTDSTRRNQAAKKASQTTKGREKNERSTQKKVCTPDKTNFFAHPMLSPKKHTQK
ncbi:hypothetical protein BDV30DRAFT_122152 [Aspergillus minisclerotigenes]|uniref:Uncharacterized protein n=1 Tax=Aspergillus minisclerotigenes TaxID=656917 RepID=A0A5N6JJS6_9EURO|nr:hypothetical protein BDV30DRAFT_122152 [Aspergillus minisclerotigenes]